MPHWEIVDKWKNKPQGQVWRVKDETGRIGYFKFAYERQWNDAGPIIGNEWLSRQLALRLNLPCAALELASLATDARTLHGIVSLPKYPDISCTWASLDETVKQHAEQHLCHIEKLIGVIAFDVWLTNIDRGSGKNIILYPGKSGCLRWYLIDHGYALYGCRRKWRLHPPQSAYWRRPWQFYHIPRGWQRLATQRRLHTVVKKIMDIPEAEIRQLIARVPDPAYSPEIKRAVFTMLVTRRKALPMMMAQWMRFRGNKESKI